MKESTIEFIKAEIKEAERMAKIGESDKLPQYYTYTEKANVLKAILLSEGVK